MYVYIYFFLIYSSIYKLMMIEKTIERVQERNNIYLIDADIMFWYKHKRPCENDGCSYIGKSPVTSIFLFFLFYVTIRYYFLQKF